MALPTHETAPVSVYYDRPRLSRMQTEAFRTVYDSPAHIGQLVLLAHTIANESAISGSEAVQLMREVAVQMYSESDSRRSKYQVDVYAGCEHGLVMNDYLWILKQRPDFLYVSDLAGSTFEGETKVIFYNKVINTARTSVGQENLRNLSSEKVEEAVIAGKDAILQGVTDGYRQLYEYVQTFSLKELSMPSPDDADGIIKWIARFTPSSENHGTWMSSLSKQTRVRILDEIGIKTRLVIDQLKLIRLRGTRIILVPGNWDGQESLELIANGDGTEAAGIKNYISIQDYAREQGLEVLPELSVVETETTFTIAAPFFWLKYDFEKFRETPEYAQLVDRAKKAKEQGKLVVCYPHAALFQSEGSGDNQKVALRTLQLMKDTGVNEVAFGHFHDKTWKDRDGRIVDPRQTAIVYQYEDEQLSFGTYIPKGDIAVAVRRKKRRQQMTKSVLPARIV